MLGTAVSDVDPVILATPRKLEVFVNHVLAMEILTQQVRVLLYISATLNKMVDFVNHALAIEI